MNAKIRIYWAVVFSLMLITGISFKADASTLWYNGDPDGTNATQNYIIGTNGYWVFDDFTVPDGGWTIDTAWGNYKVNSYNAIITQAKWEIRSGVSSGNDGTLVASGTNSATETVRVPSPDTRPSNRQSTVQVALPDVTLDPGTYWLSIAPVTSLSDALIQTTGWHHDTAVGAVGRLAENDGNSFYNFPAVPGSYFTPSTYNRDFSMGIGYSASVPEPTTMLLLGLGLVGLAGIRRKL